MALRVILLDTNGQVVFDGSRHLRRSYLYLRGRRPSLGREWCVACPLFLSQGHVAFAIRQMLIVLHNWHRCGREEFRQANGICWWWASSDDLHSNIVCGKVSMWLQSIYYQSTCLLCAYLPISTYLSLLTGISDSQFVRFSIFTGISDKIVMRFPPRWFEFLTRISKNPDTSTFTYNKCAVCVWCPPWPFSLMLSISSSLMLPGNSSSGQSPGLQSQPWSTTMRAPCG